MHEILFDVFDGTGGVVVGDTAVTVPFDTVRYVNAHSSLVDGEVYVEPPTSKIIPPDHYVLLVISNVTLYVTSGTSRSQCKLWLEYDNSPSDTPPAYTIVPGTDYYTYNRILNAGWDSVTISATFKKAKELTTPTSFRVRAQRVAGTNTIETLANASSIMCTVNY